MKLILIVSWEVALAFQLKAIHIALLLAAVGAAAKGFSVVIGNKANASGLYSHRPISFGTEASALGDISIAMGNRAKVDENAQQGTAIGASSVVSGEFGMAIGQRAKATKRSYASP
ncbi:hypothetical protein M5G07_04340 [Serratia symbiotica]|nr:hypothetical protein [Serratia symbiotica]